jgi:hypothetical protein
MSRQTYMVLSKKHEKRYFVRLICGEFDVQTIFEINSLKSINCSGLLAQQDMVGNPEKFCISGSPSVGCSVTLKLFSRLLTNKQSDFRIADAGIDTVCARIATIAYAP